MKAKQTLFYIPTEERLHIVLRKLCKEYAYSSMFLHYFPGYILLKSCGVEETVQYSLK
jgi:hypothetical protein